MRGQSSRRGAWVQGRGAAPYPVFIQQTHRPLDLSPGSRHGAPALPRVSLSGPLPAPRSHHRGRPLPLRAPATLPPTPRVFQGGSLGFLSANPG